MVTPAAIAAGAALAAGGILRAAEQEALLAGPEYIRDAEPAGIGRRLGLGLARAACQSYANDPSRVSPTRAVQFENACRPYLDSIQGGTGPIIAKPYEGGQCDCELYQFDYRIQGTSDQFGGPYDLTGSRKIRGPMGVPRYDASTSQWFISGKSANVALGASNPVCGEITESSFRAIGFPSSDSALTQFTVTSLRSEPGDCGNPPPVVTPPTAPVVPFPPVVPIVIAPEVNIDGTVEVFPDGTINIDIGTGPITIDPFGDNDNGGDTGGGGPDDSPPSPEAGPELPGGNGGFGGVDEFGPPPAGRRWVGACITITNKPTNQPPIPGSEPEDVYASVVGNIRLVYQVSGQRQTDTPVRVQAKKVCVWEAVRKLNPTGVSVDLQPGFGYTYRPYSVPLDA